MQVEALNDSKHIGVCVYNVMIISVLGVPLINLLSVTQVSIVYGITCVSIFVCSLTTLILVFGLKVSQNLLQINSLFAANIGIPTKKLV